MTADLVTSNGFVPAIGCLTVQGVYVYYDRPLLFSAVNELGDLYLVTYADDELWMIVRLSPGRLKALEAGEVDLRSAFTEPECGCVIFVQYFQESPPRLTYMLPTDPDLAQYLADPGVTFPGV